MKQNKKKTSAKVLTNGGNNIMDSSSQQPPILSTTTNSVDGNVSTTAVQQPLKTTTAAAAAARPPLLDVYKKLLLVFKPSDSVVYEDSEGNMKSLPLGDSKLLDTEPIHLSKPKVNIPVPKIEIVEDYEQNVPPNFNLKPSYYRLTKPTREEVDSLIEYTADLEDEQFVAEQQHLIRTNPNIFCCYSSNYSYFMKKTMKQQKEASATTNKQNTQIYLTIHLFEQMIDILEKATELETIIRLDQAEKILYENIASCPPPSYTWGGHYTGDSGTTSSPPDLMVERVYNYWVQKRCKLKKPLLRKYWPVTSIHDTNPHMVFRPRDKEKYKLRKKRQNDMDAFRKMQLLRKDMERLRSILDLVIRRERLLAKVVDIREEIFHQHMHDCYNTSGYTRTSKLDFQELQTLFYGTSSHSLFLEHRASLSGVSTSTSWKTTATKEYGRKRDATAMAIGSASKEHSNTNMNYPNSSTTGTTNSLPLLTQPLATRREHIVTSWNNSVPYLPHYVDGKISTIQEFNHRGRVGRGGRLCIDRFPVVFSNSSLDSTAKSRRRRTHYVGGEGPWLSLPPASSLIDLMPPTLDVKQARMKIAEICAQWSEEEEEEEELNNVNSSKPHVELVKVSDWINTDEQPWGEEKLVIGPI